jgi:hypothetical protein
MRAVPIGEHQCRVVRDHVARERRNRTGCNAAGTRPIAVGLKIEPAGLEFNDLDVATRRQAHHIGSAPIGKRKLGHHRMTERAERQADATLDLNGPPFGVRRTP